MIRVLRPAAPSAMISAVAFERGFSACLTGEVELTQVAATSWLAPLVAAPIGSPRARRAFLDATRGLDFLCPDYRTQPLTPLLALHRNRADAAIRLLVVAHAPATCPLDWFLLGPLLRPGDRIVAPTRSGAQLLELLYPELAPYVRVIPHPIAPLRGTAPRAPGRIVTLTRVHPWKLLHRQIEALAKLRREGRGDLTMVIAGSLERPGERATSGYARCLLAQIRRLGLGDDVRLVGSIDGRRKGELLSSASLLVNLSVTVEESFGKSIAEGLSCGVPILATRWDGLPETVGRGGDCVPVKDGELDMDVDVDVLAQATWRLLQGPPDPELCRAEAQRFSPERVRGRYVGELQVALRERDAGASDAGAAATSSGLLAVTAPLTHYAWDEVLALHVAGAARFAAMLAGRPVEAGDFEELRALTAAAVKRPLARQMAGLAPGPPAGTCGARSRSAPGGELGVRVAEAATSFASRSSRIACLGYLANKGLVEELRAGISSLRADGAGDSPALRYLDVECLRLQARHAEALERWVHADDAALRGELAALGMRQLAAIAREVLEPAVALAWLQVWLERFPDAPGAGPVWLDRGRAALDHRPPLLAEARAAIAAARELLGDTSEVEDVAADLLGRCASAGEP